MNIIKEIVILLNLKICFSFEMEFVDEYIINLKIRNFNHRVKYAMLSVNHIS